MVRTVETELTHSKFSREGKQGPWRNKGGHFMHVKRIALSPVGYEIPGL